MRNQKILLYMVFVLLCLLAACSNKTEDPEKVAEKGKEDVHSSGFPIVDDAITLKMFTGKPQGNSDNDWNDLPVWNEYEDMTNIQLDWVEQVPLDNIGEKRVIVMSSGQMPDVFFASQLSNSELYRYGANDVFLELNDLIDEYAPNLKKLMEENPEIRKGMTFPDGNIYAMPYIQNTDFLSIRLGKRPWIDETWLARVDMDMPDTTEEFYNFLKATQAEDDDVIPYGGGRIDDLIAWLEGSFGLNGSGDTFVDTAPGSNELRFMPITDEYRNMLEYIRKLYTEGLIDHDIFSIKWDEFIARASDGKYASMVFDDPEDAFDDTDFSSPAALEGPDGERMYTSVSSPLVQNGQFVITNENPNPAATVRWMDYFYSDEGSKLMYMGLEDETYQKKDGTYQYTDEIENAENKGQAMAEYLPWVDINPPGIVKERYFSGTETSEASKESAAKIEPYIPDDIWPEFTYTKDESGILDSTGVDVEKYAREMRDKFIAGAESLDDENWDEYVATLEEMGLDEYMEVKENAYRRYKKN